MNTHDLRIENWILARESNEPCCVQSIEKYLNIVSAYGRTTVYSYPLDITTSGLDETEKVGYEPIILTESILLKCGFELLDTDGADWNSSLSDPNNKDKYAKVYAVSSLELAVSHTGEIYTIYRCEDAYYERADMKIEFLHDLQNYYYVMNKKELNINL